MRGACKLGVLGSPYYSQAVLVNLELRCSTCYLQFTGQLPVPPMAPVNLCSINVTASLSLRDRVRMKRFRG